MSRINKKHLTSAILLAAVTALLLMQLVRAVSITSLSPTSGPVGTLVTVTGEADTLNGLIKAYFDMDGDGLIDPEEFRGSNTASGYTFTVLILVPASTAGTHAVLVNDVDAGTSTGSDFTVIPQITIDLTSGPIGTIVTITGNGFDRTSAVTIEFDGTDKTPSPAPETNEVGSFTASFSVPPSTAGDYTVTATDAAGNTDSTTFTVLGITASISPSSGPVGTMVAVSGTYATPGGSVAISWDGNFVDSVLAEEDGTYSYDLAAPASTAGEHTITAEDVESTNTAAQTFTVEPQIVLSTSAGPVGAELTVTGTGFAANAYVDVTFDAIPKVEDFATDSVGSFMTTFKVPASVAGEHTITATDTADPTIWASTTFIVVPEIVVTPTSGPVGTSVTIAGTGFAGESTVDIYFDRDANGVLEPEDLMIDDFPTDVVGGFTTSFEVLDSVYGFHIISASDAEDKAVFSVNALITLNIEDGLVGDPVTVAGTGFSGDSQVDVYFDIDRDGLLDNDELMLDNVLTNEFGSFESTFIVPWVPTAGNYLITVVDAKGVTEDATFTVLFIMYTRSDEYFQGDYPSSFIQAVDEAGEPLEDALVVVEVFDPNGYIQYKGVTITVEDGTVPYDIQFFNWWVWNYANDFELSSLHLSSDALTGTWTWTTTVGGLTINGSFEVIEPVDLRTLLEKLDQLLEGQSDVAGLITYYGNRLQLEHGELADLIASVSDELQMSLDELAALIDDVAEKLQLEHETIISLISEVSINLDLGLDELATLVTEVFNELDVKLDDISAQIIGIDEKADGLYLVIGDLEVKLDDIGATLISIQDGMATITTTLGEIEVKLGDIQAELTDLQGDVVTISTAIGEIQVSLEDIDAEIVEINDSVVTIQTNLGAIEVKLDAVQAKLVDIQGDVAVITTTLGEIETKIDSLGAVSLEEIKGDIATIKSDIGTIKVNVNNINANISSIKGRLVTIETTLGTIEVDIDNLNGKIILIQGDTATIETDIGTIKTSISDINTKIKVANDNVATIQTDIGTIKGRLTTVESNIATIETDIGTVKTSTSNIETTGESIKSDTSLQMPSIALSLIAAIGAIVAAILILRKVYMK